ncbi:MAG TPA: phage tail sheath subtilisin-like domain-containing protein [Candidatus Limnocylindrales bacterium]|nr:phage tail sheath subtilisin-like domain-containing protein [Candidatus Limnocylindrales bacterium]
MAEYLSPGVYVEETSFRSKSIEGVSTSTAGFVGPTLFGPTSGVPELLTSFGDFERIYGGLDQITFEGESESDNYVAHAVRAFFSNGGQRLYLSRAFRKRTEGDSTARLTLNSTTSPPDQLELEARYTGSGGNLTLTFTARLTQNTLAGVPRDPTQPLGVRDPVLRGVNEYDVVWIGKGAGSPVAKPTKGILYWAESITDSVTHQPTWEFHAEDNSSVFLKDLDPATDFVRVLTVGLVISYPGQVPRTDVFSKLGLHPAATTSLSATFNAILLNRSKALTYPLIFDPNGDFKNGPQVARVLFSQTRAPADLARVQRLLGNPPPGTSLTVFDTLGRDELSDTDRQVTAVLTGGDDGARPTPEEYEGTDIDPKNKTGLKAFEDLTDISIVAGPGYSYLGTIDSPIREANVLTVMELLIGHCERMRYRIAVLDSSDQMDLTTVRSYRAQVDSTYAALYYPWVVIVDPITDQEIILPPSGFVSGLYADNDIKYGVHKAPANQVVQLATRFEIMLNKGQQDVLNPEGINCFRFFEGRGYRLWGARTISSDPEWKYVNLRRYFAYLEHSLDNGTQWTVFENNSENLWSNVVRTIEDFLFSEWKSGRLMGDTPDQAYFVRCDRSTMTQDDIDNGRLICLIGVSPVRPAEFVIFRIGQWVGSQSGK